MRKIGESNISVMDTTFTIYQLGRFTRSLKHELPDVENWVDGMISALPSTPVEDPHNGSLTT